MKRIELLNILSTIRPALSKRGMVPVLTHFCFDGDSVLAYNDLIAIKAPCSLPIKGAINGYQLFGLLEHSEAKMVKITPKKKTVQVKLGKSVFDLPLLSQDDFVFELPVAKPLGQSKITNDFISGLDYCLISASKDTGRPEAMGITMKCSEDSKHAKLYSTDGNTISEIKVKIPTKGNIPAAIILPTHFCTAVVSAWFPPEDDEEGDRRQLHSGFLYFGKDHVLAKLDHCTIYSRLMTVKKSLDFEGTIKKYVKTMGKDKMVPIPKQFELALRRAQAVLGLSEVGCEARIEDGILTVASAHRREGSDIVKGRGTDPIKLKGKHPKAAAGISPDLILRAISYSDHFFLSKHIMMLTGPKGFRHIISTKPV